MSATRYTTLAAPAAAEFKDKGSRFIAHAYPIVRVEDVKTHLDPLREAHHNHQYIGKPSRVNLH